MRLYFTVIFLIALILLAFIFGSQNNQLLTLNYLIAQTEITVAAAVSIFTTIGFVLGLTAALLFSILRKLSPKQSSK